MTRKINIINYDSIVHEPPPKYHIEQCKFPCSMVISAPRQSGKTNFLLNAIVGDENGPLFYYDRIYILSLSKSQKKYKFLVDYFNTLAEEVSEKLNDDQRKKNQYDESMEDIKVDSILSITDDWTEMPQMEPRDDDDIEEGEHYLVIFDDVLKLYDTDKAFQAYVDTLYICGRHSRNPISPCFLTQNYNDLDMQLRKNSTHNFFMSYPTRALKVTLSGAISICDYKVYSEIFNKYINNSYDFILINTSESDVDRKIWVNDMTEPLPIKHLLKK